VVRRLQATPSHRQPLLPWHAEGRLMLRRGLYKSLTGEIVWLLYEIDGYVHVQNRTTGKAERIARVLFVTLYEFHSET
jgi:hypothetical protein